MVPSPYKTRIFYNFIMADDAIQVSSIEFFAWMPGICTLAAASLSMIAIGGHQRPLVRW